MAAVAVTVLVVTTSAMELSCTARMRRDRFVEVTGLYICRNNSLSLDR